MADLTYNDVARAVTDGLRNLQNEVSRISSSVGNVDRQAQLIDDIQRQLQAVEQKIDRQANDSADIDRLLNDMASLRQDIQNTNNRLMSIERFCQDISKYLQAFSQTTDDGFRSSNEG